MEPITDEQEAHDEENETDTQETNEEVVTSEPQTAEKPEEKSKDRQPTAEEFKAIDGARKHFESELKKTKEELDKAKKASQPATGDPMEAVRLGKALAEISEEEADIIVTYAKGKFNNLVPTPEQIIQASKDDWVADAIKVRREKVAGEDKTPAPSSPSSIVGGKTSEDLQEMEGKDFAKFARDTFQGGRSGV